MARTINLKEASKALERSEYSFTVVFEPVRKTQPGSRNGRKGRSSSTGYQVTVPLLPGLTTYGRTLTEAREMARDAIKCHLEGLRLSGEPIPDEKAALKEKLRVALSA